MQYQESPPPLPKPAEKLDAQQIKALKQKQRKLLEESGFPRGVVVETSHPYEARRFSWKQSVPMEGTTGLGVYFCNQCCTYDEGAMLRIYAGGLQRSASGPGARVEVAVTSGGSVYGTVMERDKSCWLVQLDQQRSVGPNAQAFDEENGPKEGDRVEARQSSGIWYPATVTDVILEADWYAATRTPSYYVVDWDDGEQEEKERKLYELRRPKVNGIKGSNGYTLDALPRSVPRYSANPNDGQECYALCVEEPKSIWVEYADMIGEEISSFCLDTYFVLTPIKIEAFQGPGPAQRAGVQQGWFLDLAGMEKEMSQHCQGVMDSLDGIGGIRATWPSAPCQVSKLLDACFNNLPDLLRNLNEQLLCKSGVKLLFSNSSSEKPVKLLPEAAAFYKDCKVGSEIASFSCIDGGEIQVDNFAASNFNPAQEAGVRTDWCLDIDKTLAQDPKIGQNFDRKLLLDDPNMLLGMSDVTLVFKQLNVDMQLKFEGSGPADLSEPSKIVPLRPNFIPNEVTWFTAGAATLKKNTGKYYHEVKLDDLCENPQLGWLTDEFTAGDYNNDGVGDDASGWGVDGVRLQNWHNGSQNAKWPKPWQKNDIVGFAIDIDGGRMNFTLNGEWAEGAAMSFEPNRTRSFYPAVSYTGLFTMHVSRDSWKFKPPSLYQPWGTGDNYVRPLLRRWHCPALPGDTVLFDFSTDGKGAESPDKRWGIWALVLPLGGEVPTEEKVEELARRWMQNMQEALTA
eukprot:CAMPEP_0172804048 /NCGR_PEP_ID=MMETSP1075-20121228/4903_1 /TAXON_ID=2916 /ORGANISM="Ceratium fusus, Strain PA161109" /LENGTH=737 /DNA_ID=CAMNT_0013642559 /DNA_START=160 /DNA_END=2373 /DNA_ORIENTATION=-